MPWVFDLAFSPDGHLLAGTTVNEDGALGEAYLWDLSGVSAEATDQDIPSLVLEESDVLLGVAFSPDGNLLAAIAVDPDTGLYAVHVWGIEGFSVERLVTLDGLQGFAFDLAFNPVPVGDAAAGSLLVAADIDLNEWTGELCLWDVSRIRESDGAGPEVTTLRAGTLLVFLSFSPDGRVLAAGDLEGTVRLWDLAAMLETGRLGPAAAVLHGNDEPVLGVAFDPDGYLLASGAEDGTARLWDVAAALQSGGSGAELTILEGHEGSVWDVDFSPDGRWLATGAEGGAVRLWALKIEDLQELACSHAVRNLSLSEWHEYLGVDTPYRQTCPNVQVHPTVIEDLVRQGEIDKALAALRQAKELNPEEEVVRLLRKIADESVSLGEASYNQILAALSEAVESLPEIKGEAAEILMYFVVDAFEEELVTYSEAVSALEKAAEWAPEVKGEAAEILTDFVADALEEDLITYAEAVSAFQQAFEWAPEVKGEAAEILTDFVADALEEDLITYAEAVSAFQQAFEWAPELRPDGAGLFVKIGQTYIDQGDYDQGLVLLRQAVEWEPDLEPELRAEEARVQALQSAAEGRFGEAQAALEQIADPDQLSRSTLRRVFETYHAVCHQGLAQDQAEQVVTACQRAIELARDWDGILLGLALCARRDIAGLADRIAAACDDLEGRARPLWPGQIVSGTIEAGQSEIWTFEGTGDQVVTISMDAARDGLDPYLALVGPNGAVVAENDDWQGRNSRIQIALPETGFYLVVARGYGSSAGAYILTLVSEGP